MQQIISTRQADCKDCYRCLRACPVKAISFVEHQARIETERCILCGLCVVECPQQAKQVRDNSALVKTLLDSKVQKVLSLAPSFPASFTDTAEVPGQLAALGFDAVEETAIGAVLTVQGYQQQINQHPDKTWLSSCCPVIVNLVEKYYPDLLDHLMPVASPMVGHARYIKEVHGNDVQVVFAGPCIAKLCEAEDNGITALTFSQLKYLAANTQKPVGTDNRPHFSELLTRLFAVDHGVLKSMDIPEADKDDYWAVDGIDECRAVLDALRQEVINPVFIELMACRGGCVNGPSVDSSHSLYKRKNLIQAWHKQCEANGNIHVNELNVPMERSFTNKSLQDKLFDEEQITEVLAQMGKFKPEDERNCEGCGYNSCRDKAVAVLRGLAVTDMCIPYMRNKAESLANTVVDNSPSAIMVLDQQMRLQSYNLAAVKLFPDIPFDRGMDISEYIDTTLFQQVLETQVSFIEQKSYFQQWNLITRQTITPLPEKGLIIVLITDITQFEQSRLHFDTVKDDISSKAREVIRRQMMAAQSIAGLLGETTAETKATLLELLEHLESDKF